MILLMRVCALLPEGDKEYNLDCVHGKENSIITLAASRMGNRNVRVQAETITIIST
jgi:hypothetical protein